MAEAVAYNFGLPTVLRFARFRSMDISLSMLGLQVRRETAQIAKGWPFSVPASRGRAPAATYDNQPDMRVPSSSRHNR